MASRRSVIKEKGIVLVETLLVLPLLLLLVFAILEYGWAFTKSGEVVNAARNGARVGVRVDATTADVVAAVTDAMNAANLGASGYQLNVTPAEVDGLDTGEPVTVEIIVTYENIELTGLPFIPVPEHVRAEVTMAKEGT